MTKSQNDVEISFCHSRESITKIPPELLLYIKKYSSCRVQRMIHQLNSELSNIFLYVLGTKYRIRGRNWIISYNIKTYTIQNNIVYDYRGNYAIILCHSFSYFEELMDNDNNNKLIRTFLPLILLELFPYRGKSIKLFNENQLNYLMKINY